jgi:hypothetical protein
MFCPVCKAEYREGFHECSDCHVALVDLLPPKNADGSASSAGSQGVEILWSGYNARVRDEIGAALDAAQIPYTDQSREVNWLPALEQRAPCEIWILRADHDAASKVISESFPEIADAADLSDAQELADPSGQTEGEAPTDDLPPEFYPEDATCEVWSGEDSYTAQFLSDSLRGVGIGCVVSGDDNKAHVFVLPDAEARAREVVREVVEGAPPQ